MSLWQQNKGIVAPVICNTQPYIYIEVCLLKLTFLVFVLFFDDENKRLVLQSRQCMLLPSSLGLDCHIGKLLLNSHRDLYSTDCQIHSQ